MRDGGGCARWEGEAGTQPTVFRYFLPSSAFPAGLDAAPESSDGGFLRVERPGAATVLQVEGGEEATSVGADVASVAVVAPGGRRIEELDEVPVHWWTG